MEFEEEIELMTGYSIAGEEIKKGIKKNYIDKRNIYKLILYFFTLLENMKNLLKVMLEAKKYLQACNCER